MSQQTEMLAQCCWPELAEPYSTALRAAVEFIVGRFSPVGIVAAGSILRGSGDAASDLDIYVIHLEPVKQRIQKYFNGVPAEIFVNPPSAIEDYLAEETAERCPRTAHMLVTGFLILDVDPIVGQLREKADKLLHSPPPRDQEALVSARYMAATRYEDAVDIAGRDPETSFLIVTQAVNDMLRLVFHEHGVYLPREKDLLRALDLIEPEVGALARSFCTTHDLRLRLALAGRLADDILGARGFSEWESTLSPTQ